MICHNVFKGRSKYFLVFLKSIHMVIFNKQVVVHTTNIFRLSLLLFRYRLRHTCILRKHEPLLPNHGKPIQKFSRNFSFPGRDIDRFLENSSIIFCDSVFVKYPGMSQTDLWKTRPIWMSYPEIGLFDAPELFDHFRLNGLSWISFPEIDLCHSPNL